MKSIKKLKAEGKLFFEIPDFYKSNNKETETKSESEINEGKLFFEIPNFYQQNGKLE